MIDPRRIIEGSRPNNRVTLFLLASMIVLTACSERAKKPAPKAAGPKAVARLSRIEGTVDHRPARTLTWSAARKEMELFNRDALKTGKSAGAVITFHTGSRLDIEEQSLVVIEAPEPAPGPKPGPGQKPTEAKDPGPVQPMARLEKGTLRGVVKPGTKPMRVVMPDGRTTEISAEGDEEVPFRIRSRKDGKMEVAVLKGSARIRSGKSEVVLKPRQVVDVSKGSISAPITLLSFPELEAPPVDAKVEAGARMELRWKLVEGATMYRVQVSHLVSFAERQYDSTVVGQRFQLPAPKARRTYVWRVSSVDASGRESEFGFARRFHVQTSTPSDLGQLLSPPHNAGIQYVGRPRPVTFRWKGKGERFMLVVARDPMLKKRVVARRRTKGTELRLPGLRSGVYYWGAFLIEGKVKKALFEQPHKLVVARRAPPHVKVPKTIKWK